MPSTPRKTAASTVRRPINVEPEQDARGDAKTARTESVRAPRNVQGQNRTGTGNKGAHS